MTEKILIYGFVGVVIMLLLGIISIPVPDIPPITTTTSTIPTTSHPALGKPCDIDSDCELLNEVALVCNKELIYPECLDPINNPEACFPKLVGECNYKSCTSPIKLPSCIITGYPQQCEKITDKYGCTIITNCLPC